MQITDTIADMLTRIRNATSATHATVGVPASNPGLRIDSNCKDMPKVMKGLGIAIVSTSKGIMTDKKAREMNVGGEVLAFVW